MPVTTEMPVKTEMIEWMRVWLETPDAFAAWVKLRKATAEWQALAAAPLGMRTFGVLPRIASSNGEDRLSIEKNWQEKHTEFSWENR